MPFRPFRLSSLVPTLLASACLVARAEEPVAWKFPEEKKGWEAIAARFNDGVTVKKDRGVTELSVKGLKQAKQGDAAAASVRVDEASGHVFEVGSNGAHFTDAEFAIFAKFPEVRALTLWHNGGTDFNGTGLAQVAGQKLEKVTLAGGSLNDAGMAELGKIKTLKEFHAWHAAYTDKGVAELKNHPALEAFRVGPQWKPNFTDAGLAALATCPKLARVGVDETWLTWDGSLHALVDRKDTLKSVDLGSCLIEPAEVEKLRAALPGAKVQWKGLAAAGAAFQKAPVRATAEKWMPKELVAKAVTEAEKAGAAAGK